MVIVFPWFFFAEKPRKGQGKKMQASPRARSAAGGNGRFSLSKIGPRKGKVMKIDSEGTSGSVARLKHFDSEAMHKNIRGSPVSSSIQVTFLTQTRKTSAVAAQSNAML